MTVGGSTSGSMQAASSSVLNLMLATQMGMARAMGRPNQRSLPSLRQQMEPERQEMQAEMQTIVLAMAADLYATLPDADLQAYLAFQQSAAGQHLTEVVIQATNAAVAEAAEELGRLVALR